MRNGESRSGDGGERQLSLPGLRLDLPGPAQKPAHGRSRGGFVRVTRDSAVARSYSDNVALGYAVAQGLARALAALSPQELADLRGIVSRGTQRASLAGR